ncbi:lipopolysaccharide heptosyltransferase II [Magnetofaba australis]|uniref:lipopolysaccharide heptosyltransferase II n=1 Tax=Magnetofaba australis IT-1 TaxID=1434232 RepID=A0A1Y2K6K7_9PROT|nr:lipopolysaccharide heptosyltransferase II [Magnetofaba australis]OSM04937.1 putative lipopolysaccharide heptosyltransferase II [Magnetofaba australis IT-1]
MSDANAPILLIGPAWVGDMVMMSAPVTLLARENPARPIDILSPPWTQPAAARIEGVRDALTLPIGHGALALSERRRIAADLKSRGYAQAIVVQRSWKSALIPWLAGIPTRTGWLGELRWGLLNDIRHLDKRALPRTVDRFAALALPLGAALPKPLPLPTLRADSDAGAAHLRELGIDPAQGPIVALCPGAEYGPAKRWPAAHFAETARRMLALGWRAALFGSPKEQALCERIADDAGPGCVSLAGRLGLDQALDALAVCSAAVTNDSGLMHVAAALGLPLAAVYGSSDPRHTPPLSDTARVLWLQIHCSPCFKRDCPLEHTDCLNDITPEQVVSALQELTA